MDEKFYAAITALLSVGVILLNTGVGMVQMGDALNGLFVITVGVVCIVIAVYLMTLLTETILKRKRGI